MMPPKNIEKLCLRARQAIEQRDWVKAKQVYLQALGFRSDLPDVHYGLATVYFQLRELTSAAHHFREVTRLDPLRAGAWINLGAILNLLQQYDEAIVTLRRAMQLDPNRVESFYNLGLVYRRKGDLELAIDAYSEALHRDPKMPDSHLNLANIYLEKKDYGKALHHYKEALKLRPGWEKPLVGIQDIKDRLTPRSELSQAEQDAEMDPEDRPIDPVAHAVFLTETHRYAIDTDETGKKFETVLGQDIEPVVKELSTCLLSPSSTRSQLADCLDKFESALDHLRALHHGMQSRLAKLREARDNLPTE